MGAAIILPGRRNHGRKSSYVFGCRCEACTEANRIVVARWRLKRYGPPKPPMAPIHGTRSRYRKGCRCDECRAAEAHYRNRYRIRQVDRIHGCLLCDRAFVTQRGQRTHETLEHSGRAAA